MSPQATLRSSLRALPPAAWILFTGTFLNKFGTFVLPFLALYLTSRGRTLAEAGVAIGSYGVGNVVATLLGGYLADHLGRRRTIVLSMFAGAASMMVLSQAESFPAILVMTALTGLTSELYRPACSALLADLIPAENRVTAFSAYRMAHNAGWAFGPATAGFLAGHGYFWLFAGDAATSVLFGGVALLALPEPAHPPAAPVGWGEAVRVVAGDRRLHGVIAAAFGIALIFNQMTSAYGVSVMRLGLTASTYGALISLNGALIVAVELPLTAVTRRFRPLHAVAFGFFLVGLGFGLNAFASSVPALAACVIIFTFGEMCSMPVLSAYVAGLAPRHMRGRYMGVYGLTWTVSQVVGPSLGLRLLGVLPTGWWLCGGAVGILSSAFALASREAAPVPDTPAAGGLVRPRSGTPPVARG
jgi:MFS family permease